MEYVPGETLETIVIEKGPLELTQALDYTCQIANAVEHAHKQGVIHRDLRPANVFVTDRGLLKVGDFGTSRFLEIAAHGTTVIGSPPYMAPEQFEGRAVFASDVYSLGVTMYQMLTGVLPYDTPAPADLERLRRGELISSARLRNPAIPTEIDAILLRALKADVGARYQTASDLLADLLDARRTVLRTPSAAGPGRSTPGWASDLKGRRPLSEGDRRSQTPTPTPSRARTRDGAAGRFCWHCRKPLPARAARCPFCGETQ
jgi:serine/threonine-protein kinase